VAEKARLASEPLVVKGQARIRKWTTSGPSSAAAFASLDSTHPLAWGGEKLTRPAKGVKKKVSRVMTLLAPPLTVEHRMTRDEESTTITGYLVTYNQEGTMTVPPKGGADPEIG
jgi:hypothetical protein